MRQIAERSGLSVGNIYHHFPSKEALFQQLLEDYWALLGDVDPLVAVMTATRWFFYFYTIERCFGMPMHFGMEPQRASREFILLLREGLLPRVGRTELSGEPLTDTSG